MMGLLRPYQNIAANQDSFMPTLYYEANYSSLQNIPYLSTPYFNNDQFDSRMGTNATSDAEYAVMLTWANSQCSKQNKVDIESNIINMFYIDFPNNQRQYTFDYYCLSNLQFNHLYILTNKTTLVMTKLSFYRVLIRNQTFNNANNRNLNALKLYESIN